MTVVRSTTEETQHDKDDAQWWGVGSLARGWPGKASLIR